jgi:AcrR family transcriptional regulator
VSHDSTVVVGDASDYGRMLPRGPHAIPQELVLANQRERLLKAATSIIAERGYAALVVSEMIERAGVSRRTFYELFEDKLDCVIAANEAASERMIRTISAACASTADWPDGVASAIGAALELAAASPDEARLVLDSINIASDPRLAPSGVAARESLAGLLRVGRRRFAKDAPAPLAVTEQAVIGAAMSVVGAKLLAGEADRLPDLGPELVQLILAPYLGDIEARRVALAR